MPWAVAAAGILAAGTIGGGLLQSSAASKAQAQAQKQFEQQRADLAPFRGAAGQTLPAQLDLLGLNGQPAADAAMANYQTSPGYQWQFNEGRRAVGARGAAMEMSRSGAEDKALDTFGQGLANSDFGTYYNRLMGVSQMGENAATGGAQTAGQSASAALGGGTAQSSIYGNTFSGLGNITNTLLSDKNFQNWISPSSSSVTDPINS